MKLSDEESLDNFIVIILMKMPRVIGIIILGIFVQIILHKLNI